MKVMINRFTIPIGILVGNNTGFLIIKGMNLKCSSTKKQQFFAITLTS